DVGITKLGLAQFYAEIWPWIRPHIVNRPLSLLRCPEGVSQPSFFQKHAWAGLDPSIRRIRLPGDDEDSLYIEDLDGLIALAQASVLEIQPWGSTIKDSERPDRMTFDLDPGPGVPWDRVLEAARELRALLLELGLESYVKTTGGKGLHVVVPIRPAADWDSVKVFSQSVAEFMARRNPDRFTASLSKRSRRRRIFVDYLRNARGATAVAAYSTRARPGAPVSTPISWDELSAEIGSMHYAVSNLPARLSHLDSDPWAGIGSSDQELPKPIGEKGIGKPIGKANDRKASNPGT